MHYYKFNIADYRKDTTHLTPMEHYIYRQLIDWYYLDEMPIPSDNPVVMRRLGLGSENAKTLEIILNEFFVLGEKGWENSRCNDDIEAYQVYCEKQRTNGGKGGRPKKPKINPLVPKTKPKITLTTNHKPLTTNKNKDLSETSSDDCSEVFRHWVKVMGKDPTKIKLSNERMSKIKARLKDYSVEQIKSGINGCKNSKYHMGANDSGRVYNDIELICRNTVKLDSFIEAGSSSASYNSRDPKSFLREAN